MAGLVEERLRNKIKPGKKLTTPARNSPFKMTAFSDKGVVLSVGERAARATLPWPCLEALPRFLVGRGWVPLSGAFDPQTSSGTLETHLLAYGSTVSPGALAALLEAAEIVELDAERPAKVRLSPDATELATASTSTGQFSTGTRKMQEGKYRPHPGRG